MFSRFVKYNSEELSVVTYLVTSDNSPVMQYIYQILSLEVANSSNNLEKGLGNKNSLDDKYLRGFQSENKKFFQLFYGKLVFLSFFEKKLIFMMRSGLKNFTLINKSSDLTFTE